MSHIDRIVSDFHLLLEGKKFREADEAAYNVVVILGLKTPEPIIDYLFMRTPDQSWLKTAPIAGISMAVLMSQIENDRASQGTAAQSYIACLDSKDPVVAARANFHIAEMMLQDPKPSALLRARIEGCLSRAVSLQHAEAALLLGTLYAHGVLADDGEPNPELGAELYVRAIEEFRIKGARKLLLALMEKFGITVPGYDINALKGQAGTH